MKSDRTVGRHGKPMPETGLDQTGGKQLSHNLQGVDGLLGGLGRETIHQVGMYQNARLAEVVCHLRHLRNRYPRVDQL